MELELDAQGNIKAYPLAEYQTHRLPAFGTGLLVMRYPRTPEEFEKEAGPVVQLLLTPAQCLDLADALRRMANSIPAQSPPGQGPAS